MSNEMEEFLNEGMKRYKPASAVLVQFGKQVEGRLKGILVNRKPGTLGVFIPTKGAVARSTTYWSAYPLLNARIDGQLWGTAVKLMIAVNWYLSETDYPFYAVSLEPADSFLPKLREFSWSPGYEFVEKDLRLYPNEDDFNLERDFTLLLDEFSRFLSSAERERG